MEAVCALWQGIGDGTQMMSALEEKFLRLWTILKRPSTPDPVPQTRFAFAPSGRAYRGDFVWIYEQVVVEIQGGVWVRGRHVRGAGFEHDSQRALIAAGLGWLILPVTAKMLDYSPSVVVRQIENILMERNAVRQAVKRPSKIAVVNINTGAECDVYIGSGCSRYSKSIFHNPFKVGRDGTREEVLSQFETYFRASPDLMALAYTLRGKRLGCHCAPEACHGDVIKRILEE